MLRASCWQTARIWRPIAAPSKPLCSISRPYLDPTGRDKFDVNDEEGWTLLPNKHMLTVDAYVFQYDPTGMNSELYNPKPGTWRSAGSTVVQRWDSAADCGGLRRREGSPPLSWDPECYDPTARFFTLDGDDVQAATDYPLVRITNLETGHVFYSRTHDHSNMAVASDDLVSTHYEVPAVQESGLNELVAVADGISSNPAPVYVE